MVLWIATDASRGCAIEIDGIFEPEWAARQLPEALSVTVLASKHGLTHCNEGGSIYARDF